MKVRIVLACALAFAGLTAHGTAGAWEQTGESCAEGVLAESGEWPSYGNGFGNSRTQWNETVLDPATVAQATKLWEFNAEEAQIGGGTFSNTPVAADGCVYLGSTSGFVYAVNAETGRLVWKSDKFEGGPTSSLAGAIITGSPVVDGGRVYVGVSKVNDPYVVALDQATGQTIGVWDALTPENQAAGHRTASVSAPIVWNGVLFQGIMSDEGSAVARGGWSILDVDPNNAIPDGTILNNGWTIDDASWEAGYRGASIWCTPAMDPETGFLYACGGNPASKQHEHRFSNALLKFDIARARDASRNPVPSSEVTATTNPDFGTIVDSYKGDVDQYYPGLDRQPACDTYPTDLVWSPTCVQLDLDFGSSPNLYTIDVGGTPVKVVGALQKSGVYHAVYADHMERAWTTIVGTPCVACNASSSAYDAEHIYIGANLPGQVWALTKDFGRYRWVFPVPNGTYFQSISSANGVVYSMDNLGNLNAFDASTGLQVLKRNLALDTTGNQSAVATSSQGVAIAYNTIYAASDQFVIAYR